MDPAFKRNKYIQIFFGIHEGAWPLKRSRCRHVYSIKNKFQEIWYVGRRGLNSSG
jgi:hypothetical protein